MLILYGTWYTLWFRACCHCRKCQPADWVSRNSLTDWLMLCFNLCLAHRFLEDFCIPSTAFCTVPLNTLWCVPCFSGFAWSRNNILAIVAWSLTCWRKIQKKIEYSRKCPGIRKEAIRIMSGHSATGVFSSPNSQLVWVDIGLDNRTKSTTEYFRCEDNLAISDT